MEFTQEQKEIIINAGQYVTEFFVEERKGQSQNKFVILVKKDEVYWCDEEDSMVLVPKELTGYWMMVRQDDLYYYTWEKAIQDFEWIKCEEVEVTVTEWREI